MDVLEFRASLHQALEHAPPSMSPANALRAARRTTRRRTLAAGTAGAGALAVLTAAGLVVTTGGGAAPQQAAGPGVPGLAPGGGTPTVAPPVPGNPSGSDTKPVWPTGPDGSPQGDRTAKAGVKADAAKALLAHLITVVPSGFTVPDDQGTGDTSPSRSQQAQFEDKVGGRDAWSYLASVEIRRGGTAGRLIVEVHEPGLRQGATPCDIAEGFWSKPTGCTTVQVGGVTVAVATGGPEDDRVDKWAAYAYPDGTAVYVGESRVGGFGPGDVTPGLSAPPFSDEQLAALALDQAFHIVA
jgi:hypothetical protein